MTALSLENEWAALGLSEEIHAPFAQLMQALCAKRRSAMVMCDDTDELDAVGRAVSRSLRHMPGMQMEVVRPTSTEALLARFNQLVEALPLDKARSEHHIEPTLTLWVMHLSRRLELPEVKLLLNMVQGFPGTGVRLLLLCSREAASPEAAQVAARWGSRLHRWVVRPAPEASYEGTVAARPLNGRPAVAVPAAVLPAATPSAAKHTASATLIRARLQAMSRLVRAGCVRLQPFVQAVTRLLVRACKAIDRTTRLDRLRTALARRLSALRPRWAWGVGGVLMSVGATAAAWWHARPQGDDASMAPLRRPVPEIVELLDDARPHAVRQEQRS
jgi:hypothetical protein